MSNFNFKFSKLDGLCRIVLLASIYLIPTYSSALPPAVSSGSGVGVKITQKSVLCDTATSFVVDKRGMGTSGSNVMTLSNTKMGTLCPGKYRFASSCYLAVRSGGDSNPCPGGACDESLNFYSNAGRVFGTGNFDQDDNDNRALWRNDSFDYYPATQGAITQAMIQGESEGYQKLEYCSINVSLITRF